MASAKDIASALTGAIGANDESATVNRFLDTGFPPLNHALSGKWDGGFPVGRMIEVSGPASAGKTAIATRVMASAQTQGGIAGFSDHERSFSQVLAPKLGLNITPGPFIYKKPETLEESIGISIKAARIIRDKKLIPEKAPIVWVFDSLAAMVPSALLYDSKGEARDPGQRNMKDNLALAAACSAHLPALAQSAEDLGMCVVILNQLRTKPGVLYGDPTYTPGGDAKEYYYSQRLRLSSSKIQHGKGSDAVIVGAEVTGKVTKNKIYRPFLKANWRFMFQNDGTGRFDIERSMIEFLEDQKILKTGQPGFVEWKGKKIGKETLARQIEKDNAFNELKALLPKEYEPEVIEEVPVEAA